LRLLAESGAAVVRELGAGGVTLTRERPLRVPE